MADSKILKILIVEDNEICAKGAALILKEVYPDVLLDFAVNSADGVAKAMVGDYDLILMDIGLPDFDGILATKAIRFLERECEKKSTPIIGLTIDNKYESCIAAGMQDCLIKPLTIKKAKSIFNHYVLEGEKKNYARFVYDFKIGFDKLGSLTIEYTIR